MMFPHVSLYYYFSLFVQKSWQFLSICNCLSSPKYFILTINKNNISLYNTYFLFISLILHDKVIDLLIFNLNNFVKMNESESNFSIKSHLIWCGTQSLKLIFTSIFRVFRYQKHCLFHIFSPFFFWPNKFNESFQSAPLNIICIRILLLYKFVEPFYIKWIAINLLCFYLFVTYFICLYSWYSFLFDNYCYK